MLRGCAIARVHARDGDDEALTFSALRWLRRRVRAVEAVVDAVSRLPLETVTSDREPLLLGLRRALSLRSLNVLPAPLGFSSRRLRLSRTAAVGLAARPPPPS